MRTQLNVRLPDSHLARLNELATDWGLTQSETIMRLIDQAYGQKINNIEWSVQTMNDIKRMNTQLDALNEKRRKLLRPLERAGTPFEEWPAETANRISVLESEMKKLEHRRDDALEAYGRRQSASDVHRFVHIRDREAADRRAGDL